MTDRGPACGGARFHCPLPLAQGELLTLPERIAHHVRVLRLKPGAALALFNGEGGEFEAQLVSSDRRGASARIGAWHGVERESPLRLVLAQGISAAEKMDYTIQKAVELGVTSLQPVGTTRSVVRLDDERAQRRLAHWHQIAIAACEQCGRNRVPDVLPVAPLRSWLSRAQEGTRLLLTPRATQRLADLPPADHIVLLAGPEGGLTAEEEAAAQVAGFSAVSLGPRVLRTETVALAALAALQSRWGDL